MKKMKLIATSLLLAITCNMTSFAGSWQNDGIGYWYQNDDGSYPTNAWQWIDGNNDGVSEMYYFDTNGYCLLNTTAPDGQIVDENGALIINGVVQTQAATTIPDTTTASNTNTASTTASTTNTTTSQSANSKAENKQVTNTNKQTAQASTSAVSSVPYDGYSIIVNTNSMKYHKPDCSTIRRMLPEHFGYASSAFELEALGYTPCGWCHR